MKEVSELHKHVVLQLESVLIAKEKDHIDKVYKK